MLCLGTFALAAVLAAPPAVPGQRRSSTTVVLVSQREGPRGRYLPAAEAQARGELGALGLVVKEASGSARYPAERRLELVALAEQNRAMAAVRLFKQDGDVTIELWVTDRHDGKLRLRTLGEGRAAAAAEPTARSIALAVVEMLNAGLFDIGVDLGAPKEPSPQATVDVTAAPARAPGAPAQARFALRVGAELLAPRGSPAVLVGPSVGLRWHLSARLAVEGQAAGLAWGAHFEQATARADVRAAFTTLGVAVTPLAGRLLAAELGVRAGMLALHASGSAAAPLVPRSSTGASALALVSAGLTLSPVPGAALRARLGAGYSPSRFAVVLGREAVALLSSPWLEGELAATWEW